MTTGPSGMPRARSRLLNRSIRVINTLLIVGLLTYLCLRPSVDLTLSMIDTSISGQTEPGIDSGLSYGNTIPSNVDWSRYAYIQYITDSTYLCNSLMIFESLHRLGSKAERLMMYPDEWSTSLESPDAELLRKARDQYNVRLQPVRIQRLEGDITWGESFTKLLAFNQTQYQRVISLDSDANVLQVSDVSMICLVRWGNADLTSLWMNCSSCRKPLLSCLERIGWTIRCLPNSWSYNRPRKNSGAYNMPLPTAT
jgi:alpha-N-acetylglucosamine transferase